MLMAFGIPIGIGFYILWKHDKKLNDLTEKTVHISDAVIEHLEDHYQDRIDEMFHVLTNELDDE